MDKQKMFVLIFKMMLFSLVYGTTAYAQDFKLLTKIDTVAKIADIDNFGNLFIVTPANDVMKFDPKGIFLWSYANKSYGEISQLDVTDPLRIILYYAAYQQIVVLNNNLSEIGNYSFNQNPDLQISLVASTNNNGFWAYDQINRELKKLSNFFVEDLKSGNIYQRNGFDMHATAMVTENQQVYINDTTAGIRIFDRYGNFIKTAVIDIEDGFNVEGNEVYFTKGNKLMSYNYLTFDLKEIPLPESSDFKKAILRFGRLVILGEKDLTLWAVKKN